MWRTETVQLSWDMQPFSDCGWKENDIACTKLKQQTRYAMFGIDPEFEILNNYAVAATTLSFGALWHPIFVRHCTRRRVASGGSGGVTHVTEMEFLIWIL